MSHFNSNLDVVIGGQACSEWGGTEEACAACRASGIYTSNQESANEYGRAATEAVESAYRKGKDALDQGFQVNILLPGCCDLVTVIQGGR